MSAGLVSAMVLLSSQNVLFNRMLKFYSAHRLIVQRIMNASFLVYLLRGTYGGFNSAGKDPSKDNRKGKPGRVAVCRCTVNTCYSLTKAIGRCTLLSTVEDYITDSHTWITL